MRKPRPITGSVQPLSGWYYAVINMYVDGKRKQDWVNTEIKSTGSKRKAAQFLQEELAKRNEEKNKPQRLKDASADMLFLDYLHLWLKTKRTKIEAITYNGYETRIENWIKRYFSPINARLSTLEPSDFEDFYNTMYEEGVSGTTALSYHRLMKQALGYAVKKDILLYNVMDKVDAPRKNNFVASYYSKEEALELLELAKDDPIYLPILLSTYYGLRRSEVLGLRWRSIDFKENRISIEHKVVEFERKGEKVIIASDNMKTISSRRSMPLIPKVAEELKKAKAQQEENRRAFKKSYSKDKNGYVCVDALGNLLMPNFVSSHFAWFLRKHELRHIRFHELRHTCASLLAISGLPIKQIQIWLGHSNYSTTADIYTHLDYKSQEASANMVERIFGE
ncbi:site-specific integrase [Oscillospiraceae bacterium OttesenSCG-928-F05]|nr:site-specific integrase [Oscillospiraceae bacterium OttesenSCG-928-F05]